MQSYDHYKLEPMVHYSGAHEQEAQFFSYMSWAISVDFQKIIYFHFIPS